MAGTSCCVVLLVAHLAGDAEGAHTCGNRVEHLGCCFGKAGDRCFARHRVDGRLLRTNALERIRPQEATIYTVARETPVAGLAKAAPEVLDTIAARVRALGIPCQVSY